MLSWEGLVNLKINKIDERFQSTVRLSSQLSSRLGITDMVTNIIKIGYGRFRN